jgi:hypothetical protein
MKVNRIKWNNDKPASEKQVDFVKSLLYRIKIDRPAATIIGNDDRMMWELWETAEVPADMTATEASGLIDLLRNAYWNSRSLAMDIASALLKRYEGSGVNATKDRALLMLALTDCQSVIAGIKPEKIEAAKAVRASRQAVKA